MSGVEHPHFLGLEQRCIEPGHWVIEGWDVLRVSCRGYGTQWVARLFDQQFTRRTLADIRDHIRSI